MGSFPPHMVARASRAVVLLAALAFAAYLYTAWDVALVVTILVAVAGAVLVGVEESAREARRAELRGRLDRYVR